MASQVLSSLFTVLKSFGYITMIIKSYWPLLFMTNIIILLKRAEAVQPYQMTAVYIDRLDGSTCKPHEFTKISGLGGYILSHDASLATYKPSQQCFLIIEVPENYQIAVQAEEFDLGYTADSEKCDVDSLFLFDNQPEDGKIFDSNLDMLREYCSTVNSGDNLITEPNSIPSPYTLAISSNNSITLYWHAAELARRRNNAKGFKLKWFAMKRTLQRTPENMLLECNPDMDFMCSNEQACIPVELACDPVMHCADGSDLVKKRQLTAGCENIEADSLLADMSGTTVAAIVVLAVAVALLTLGLCLRCCCSYCCDGLSCSSDPSSSSALSLSKSSSGSHHHNKQPIKAYSQQQQRLHQHQQAQQDPYYQPAPVLGDSARPLPTPPNATYPAFGGPGVLNDHTAANGLLDGAAASSSSTSGGVGSSRHSGGAGRRVPSPPAPPPPSDAILQQQHQQQSGYNNNNNNRNRHNFIQQNDNTNSYTTVPPLTIQNLQNFNAAGQLQYTNNGTKNNVLVNQYMANNSGGTRQQYTEQSENNFYPHHQQQSNNYYGISAAPSNNIHNENNYPYNQQQYYSSANDII